jgi:hypothetical protein
MESLSSQDVANLAQRFDVSQSAVEVLARAVQRGNGAMAQFDHPELGGLGQWTRGGMTMIGDMFNDTLNAKVNEICSELVKLGREGSEAHEHDRLWPSPKDATNSSDHWWGEDLGYRGASGSQNDVSYAYFPTARRLATRIDDYVKIYDTGEHQIVGVSQQQSVGYSLTFLSQLGLVSLDQLKVVNKTETSSSSGSKAKKQFE